MKKINQLALLMPVLAMILSAYAAFAAETTDNNIQSNTEASGASSTETNSETNAKTGSESNTEKNADQLAVVLAIEADTDYGAYLGGECLTCHTPSAGDGSIPVIHAKNKDYIASALLEYKNQQRASDVMQGVTAALTSEEIAALAAYFSNQ